MKVIILKNFKGLGKIGEIKELADGYARNFLIPRGLVKPVTPPEIARLASEAAAATKKAEKDLRNVQNIAKQIDGYELEIFEKASEKGTLYSALTAAKIAKALQEKGFTLNKKQIKIDQPMKELGEHEVILTFEHGLEVKIKVIITEKVA